MGYIMLLFSHLLFVCSGLSQLASLADSLCPVIQSGPAEFASSHSCGSHLSSKDNRAKWHLWKLFKARSCEQPVASRHAGKTFTALRATEADLLQPRPLYLALIDVGSFPYHKRVTPDRPYQECILGGVSMRPFRFLPECNRCIHKSHSWPEIDCADLSSAGVKMTL